MEDVVSVAMLSRRLLSEESEAVFIFTCYGHCITDPGTHLYGILIFLNTMSLLLVRPLNAVIYFRFIFPVLKVIQ